MFFLLMFIVFLSVLFESTVTSLPLLLIVVSIMLILFSTEQNTLIFGLAFFGGLFLDITVVHTVGSSSIFLACWLFLILLYKRKYQIDSIQFVVASSFFGSFLYLWFLGGAHIFFQSLVSLLVGSVLFIVLRIFIPQKYASKREKLQFTI